VTIGIAGSSSLRATRSNLGKAELDCRTAFAMTNKKPQNEWSRVYLYENRLDIM